MKNEEGSFKDNNFGAILLVILISFFAFTFEGRSNQSASASAPFYLQPDLSSEYCAIQPDAVISDRPQLPFVVKDCGCSLSSPDLNLFNLQYSISDYNRRIVRQIILIQRTRLSIEPYSFCTYFVPHTAEEKEDLPVLS